jgi:hypothetical protein
VNPFPNIVALLVDVPAVGIAVVTAADGAFAVPAAGGYIPCDVTDGPVGPIQFPIAPADQAVIIIADVSGLSSLSPIRYAAQGATTLGPITVFDASWNGSGPLYGFSGHIALVGPGAVWFVFVASANKWMPGN